MGAREVLDDSGDASVRFIRDTSLEVRGPFFTFLKLNAATLRSILQLVEELGEVLLGIVNGE